MTSTGSATSTTTDGARPAPELGALLLAQLTAHWGDQLRPRLDGLTDGEYHFSPVADDETWDVRPRGTSHTPVQGGSGDHTVDFAFPEPQPTPFTTIAWRIAHLLVGVFGTRLNAHFGGPEVDYSSYDYPGDAATALERLDAAFTAWVDGVRSLDPAALAAPCGPAEGEWADRSMAELVLHISREVIHHGAECCLLRDLYAHR